MQGLSSALFPLWISCKCQKENDWMDEIKWSVTRKLRSTKSF